jgi:glycosyltransferase involved in cell wall biosynthesis
MGKFKVVHLVTRLDMGGAQGNTLYTVENLNADEFDSFLWYGAGGYWDEHVENSAYLKPRSRVFKRLVRSLHPVWDIVVIWDLYRALRELKPDILHTHSSKAGIVGRIAGWLARVPLIIHTYHGFGFNEEQISFIRTFFVGLEKLTAPLAQKLIFVSQSNLNEARSRNIGHPDQYKLIRSGIQLGGFFRNQDPAVRDTLRLAWGIGAEPVITTIGPFKPQKNLIDFLDVCSRLAVQYPTLKAYVVGDGEERSKLEAFLQTRNLLDRVTLLGWRRDVADILAISDIFVMTSLWEGLPRALAEAMASGLPSVCYDTDGVRDLLSQGGGILIPKKDVQMMTKEIDALLRDKNKAGQLGREAPTLVKDEFDIDRMVKQQEQLYMTLANPSN